MARVRYINIEKVLDMFEAYDVEYDYRFKRLLVNKAMLVKDFVYLRQLVSIIDKDIQIIVDGEMNYRKHRKYWGY